MKKDKSLPGERPGTGRPSGQPPLNQPVQRGATRSTGQPSGERPPDQPVKSALEKAEERLHEEEQQTRHKDEQLVTIPEAEYSTLRQQAQELTLLKDRLLRQAADFDNAKKRLAKEKEEFLTFANEHLIREFLPMLDHLDLALSHAATNPQAVDALISGMQLIKKDLLDNLKTHGLEIVETKDKIFDPHVHESIGYVHTAVVPEDIIVEEMQTGYTLKGKLIRPAKVRIAHTPPPPSEQPGTERPNASPET